CLAVWCSVCGRWLRQKDCRSARWSVERCSLCCHEGEGVGEPKPVRQRNLRLEYRFDRLLAGKLSQAYQLLVPDRRKTIGVKKPKPAKPKMEVSHEQASSDLCARVLGSPGKAWRLLIYWPCGVRCTGGVTLIRAQVRNLRTWSAVIREKAQAVALR